nr:sodium:solute symporter [Saprospiraceae bacterium]
DASIETNDRDYVFLHFFLHHLPKGLVGLLLAVIFSAAMSSSSAELNSLSSTTTVDMYKRLIRPQATDKHYLYMSKAFTFFWGIVAVGFAFFASLAENLIQFVNIVGSLFYGTILGIFMAAFYVKRITAWPVFLGTILSEATILILFFKSDISFLWLNPIGCFLVIGFSLILQPVFKRVPV